MNATWHRTHIQVALVIFVGEVRHLHSAVVFSIGAVQFALPLQPEVPLVEKDQLRLAVVSRRVAVAFLDFRNLATSWEQMNVIGCFVNVIRAFWIDGFDKSEPTLTVACCTSPDLTLAIRSGNSGWQI